MLSHVLLSHRAVIPILAARWKRYANMTLEKLLVPGSQPRESNSIRPRHYYIVQPDSEPLQSGLDNEEGVDVADSGTGGAQTSGQRLLSPGNLLPWAVRTLELKETETQRCLVEIRCGEEAGMGRACTGI